uniref:scavenger receptor cysteine-rich type 1 protein M130-like n=1 Tax=Maylandia zebra TaxID=106582 RepID=UPI000D2FA35F|nr:scavenger receptor cysteine-rich type 1 protein M130-like [Maylandia zebra]
MCRSEQRDVDLDMENLLLLLLLLPWSSGKRAWIVHVHAPGDVRLVGGASRCAGILELKHLGEWRPVIGSFYDWPLRQAADSVRLLNGSSLCSGRLQVKSNQKWSSVCEADFDLQDAEVVCRELGCGPPSVLQGALYGEVEAPVWGKEFQCEGLESALLDCRSSGSARKNCSPGKAVGLTCSEPLGLVGGASRCAGTLEFKHLGEWRQVAGFYSKRTLKEAAVVCELLDCGSAVYTGNTNRLPYKAKSVWLMKPECLQSGSALRECLTSHVGPPYGVHIMTEYRSHMDLTCSGKPISDINIIIISRLVG